MPAITAFFKSDGKNTSLTKRKRADDDRKVKKEPKLEGSSGFDVPNPFEDDDDKEEAFRAAWREAGFEDVKQKRTTSQRHVMWFKSDLRILDNRALTAAAESDDSAVLAIYVLCPGEWENHHVSHAKADFVFRNLSDLGDRLESELGIPLVVLNAARPRDIPPTIEKFCKQHEINRLFFNREYEVNERARDRRVTEELERVGVQVDSFEDQNVMPPAELLSPKGKPYTVYSPYQRAWLAKVAGNPDKYLTIASLPRRNPPDTKLPLRTVLTTIENPRPLRDGEQGVPALFPAGEVEAHHRLYLFRAGEMKNYVEGRNIPSNSGTSKLSAYLSNGVISLRHCTLASLNGTSPKRIGSIQAGHARWLSELIWRDFYRMIMYSFPQVCKYKPYRAEAACIKWREGPEADADFQRWVDGKTGYPLVDAAMRQMDKTCYMHNRCRMNVASFLCKHLMIDWRRGEKYFSEKLIDADLASNNGGWQWTASSGTDPQPYFRVFAPTLQSEKFDPAGDYIRYWIPELKHCPPAKMAIHEPWTRWGKAECTKAGYPAPMVDHKAARQRCLTEYKRAFDEYKFGSYEYE
ncbi:DNA photolyase phr1 [Savitreella phatthalungensis]